MVLMICDFKRANPEIKPAQILRSQWLDQLGGVVKIKALFGRLDNLISLADDALALSTGVAMPEEEPHVSHT
jgi:hypothetical protein